MPEHAYIFASGTDEERRLRDHSTVLDPITDRLLTDAGLEPGMRVLELGSGMGNVALVAARHVGPEGRVVGVDRDPDSVARARRLAADHGNVEFREGDLYDLDGIGGEFDAVVGRLVLAHLPDPVVALRIAAERVRPGGLVCMHEADMTYSWTSRETPLWAQLRSWILATLEEAGADAWMGPSLFATFRAAGLPDPELVMEAPLGGGRNAPTFGWVNLVGALLPLMKRLDIASSDDVDLATLADRLEAEISLHNGTVMGPPMYGAWCRRPST